MHMDRINIIAPNPQAHSEALFAMLDLEWENESTRARIGRISGSHYDWQTSRIGLIDNTVVTHYGVYDLTMRVGSARVHTAGVNLVATHPAYRQRGLMTQTTWMPNRAASKIWLRLYEYEQRERTGAVDDLFA